MTFLLAGLLVSGFLVPEGVWQLVTILVTCGLFLIPCLYALKLEVGVGAYKCKQCGHEIVPTYSEVMRSMHIGFTRYLWCSECNKRTWCKKVLKK
jgi:DNA-directed RNA polymerase subunit RPC12/RpoP